MEQVIHAHEVEQEIRSEIESTFELIMLDTEQIKSTRELWKEVFPEETKEFLDYYFTYGVKDAIVCAVQEEETISALYLTPCSAAMRRVPHLLEMHHLPCMTDIARVDTYLISAAVTKQAYRKRGYMRRLLSGVFEYQRRLKIPFCMVSAKESIFFEHFGFHYIYDKPHYELNTKMISKEMLERAAGGEIVHLSPYNVTLSMADKGDLLLLAHFVNANLCKRYGVFNIRSAVYYERFQQELRSRKGELYQIIEDGQIKGYFAYAKDSVEQICEVVFENEADIESFFYTTKTKKPTTMARIVNLDEILKHIASNGKVTIAIRLVDPIIAENDGLFIWYLNENGSRMERVEEVCDGDDPSMRPEVTTTIGEFTAFIFGYSKLKQNTKFDSIYLSGPTWLNERL